MAAQEWLVNVTAHETRVAVLEKNQLQEIYIERTAQQSRVGHFYKGRVLRIVPGMQAAFVDIGLERAAFLHANDIAHASSDAIDVRQLLKQDQDILVQVSKEALGSKGARLTTRFAIPARYIVLTPNVFQIQVSQKITDGHVRDRLLALISPGQYGGYIFRTSAVQAPLEAIQADQFFLDHAWASILEKNQHAKIGECVYQNLPLLLRLLRDSVAHDIARIRVDDEAAIKMMQTFAERYAPHFLNCIERHQELRPIFDMYLVEEELQKLLQRKVYLKSGGHLVFDQTEALITIDVNTGSYVGRDDAAETILKTNLEAAREIARQVRLRNLGGIIIIDFIDMLQAQHQEDVIQALTKALGKDMSRIQLSRLSDLGLLQMTRKRTHESLERTLCQPCPTCQRRGFIKSPETVLYDILRDIQRSADVFSWPGFVVLASAKTISYLQRQDPNSLKSLELSLGKSIQLKVESTYSDEQFSLQPADIK